MSHAAALGQHVQTLNTAFGDAPLGQLGNKPVSAQEPGAPRTPLGKVAHAVKSLGQHIVKSLAPASARANAEVREATRQFSAHLGNALGGLQALGKTVSLPKPDHPSADPEVVHSPESLVVKAEQDAKALKQAQAAHVSQFAKATVDALSQVLTDAKALAQHGIGLQEALDARIDLHLKSLDRDQLADLLHGCTSDAGLALMKQMANERRDGVSQALNTILRRGSEMLQQQVHKDIASDVDETLAKALAVVDVPKQASGRDEFSNQYNKAAGKASMGSSALYHGGVLPKPPGRAEELANQGFVKEGLGRMNGADLQRLLTRVDTGDLKQLLLAQSPNGVDMTAVDAALRREVQARTERLTQAVGEAQHALAEALAENGGPSGGGGPRAAAAVAQGAQAMAELIRHADTHGLPPSTKTPEALALLNVQAKALLSKHPDALRSLTHPQLANLHKALGQLGLSAEQALTVKAIDRRQEAAVKAFVPSMQQLATVAQGKAQLQPVMVAASQTYEQLNTLSLTFQSLGTRLADTPQQKEFLQLQIDDAVAALTDDQRASLKAFFEQPDLRELAHTCYGAAVLHDDPAVGTAMTNLADMLVMTAAAVGAPMAPPEAQPTQAPGHNASPAVARAVYGQFGVVVGQGNTEASLWLASADPKQVMLQLLTDPARQPLLDRFADTCDRLLCRENLDFWQGVQALQQAPSVAAAQDLFNHFILANGAHDTQINIDNGTMQSLMQQFPATLAAVQNGQASPAALAALFVPAQNTVLDMMSLDTLKKFSEAVKGEAR